MAVDVYACSSLVWVVLGWVLVWLMFSRLPIGRLHEPLRVELARALAWSLTLIAWPAAWNALCATSSPLALVGFVWPFVILAADVGLAWNECLDEPSKVIHLEQGAMCSMMMALCGIVGASSANDQPERQRVAVIPMLAYAIFVMPYVNDDSSKRRNASFTSLVAKSLQRSVFACLTGLMACAVLFDAKPFLKKSM